MARTGRPRAERTQVLCTCCSKPIMKTARELAHSRSGRFFCSRTCQDLVGSKPRLGGNRTCLRPACDKEFYVGPTDRQLYCSKPCADLDTRVARAAFKCEQCGTTFEVVPSLASHNANRFCSRACMGAFRRAEALGNARLGSDGYVRIFQPDHPAADANGTVPEHHLVMERMIGRFLVWSENVHHKNGVRHDNRPGNLELWSKSQPSGQRVADKIAWARELLALYADVDETVIG